MDRYTRQSAALAAFALIVSLVVLAGWLADVSSVKSVVPGLATMKFNTALCFLLSGLSLLVLVLWNRYRWSLGLASVSCLVALLTLVEYAAGFGLGIDELVVSDVATALENHPGRMSMATAVCFVMLDLALIFLALKQQEARRVALGKIFALVVFVGGMIGLVGYVFEVSALYDIFWFSTMAVHTSALFVLMAVGCMLVVPQVGLSEPIVSPLMGGRLARRLLPLALLLPLLIGWLLMKGADQGLYQLAMIVDLFAVASMIAFCGVVWVQALKLNRSHRDLLEHTKYLEQARREQALLAAIIESSEDAIVSEDLGGRITSWNPAAVRMFGYSEDEMLGQTLARLLPDDVSDTEEGLAQAIREGRGVGHCETMRMCKDGSVLKVSLVVSDVTDEEDQAVGISSIFRDVTERRQTEADLKTSLREIRDLKSALDEHAIVAITDPRGRITYVNDTFCKISQYTREELIGQDHRMLNSGYHPKSFIKELWGTITQGKIWRGKLRNCAKDGSYYWVDTTIVPFIDENGKPRQYVAVRTDITESVKAADALIAQTTELERSNKDLEQFAYIASHDLQEPLRAVAGCAQLLKKRYSGQLDARADEFISHTVDGAERMQRLIQDLLAFSRVSTRGKEIQSINLEATYKAAMKNLASMIEETGAVVTHDAMPQIRGDSGQLTMLFQNLIGNAIKFRGEKTPEVHVGVRREGAEWLISIQDNGVGIESEYFERIFVIFQRLHTREEYDGTGIGLSLCKRIVERHGGRIWVESTQGEGSVFHFTLRIDKNGESN